MAVLARGSVTDRPWGMTFGALGVRGLTGQLTLTADGKQFRVAFDQGIITGAYSPIATDSAVRLALTMNLVTSSQVSDITRRMAAAPGRDEVDLLVELARLSPDVAPRLRRRHVAQQAARTFAYERGDFIVEDQVTMPVVPGAELDVRTIVYLGAKTNVTEERLAAELAQIGSFFVLKPSAFGDLAQFGFGAAEQPALKMIMEGAYLDEMVAAHPGIGVRTIRAVMYALASCSALELGAPPRAPRANTPSSAPTFRHELDAPTNLRSSGVPIATSSHGGSGPSMARTSTSSGPTVARTNTSSGPTVARTSTASDPTVSRTGTGSGPNVSRTSTASDPTVSRAGSDPNASRTNTGPTVSRTGSEPNVPRANTGPTVSRTGSDPNAAPTVSRTGSEPNPASGPTVSRTGSEPNVPRANTGPTVSRTSTGSGVRPRPPTPSATSPSPARARTPSMPPPGTEGVVRMKPPTNAPPMPTAAIAAPTQPIRKAAVATRRARRDSTAANEIETLLASKMPLLERGADHFTLLGLSMDAPAADVRSAYFTLARKLHPDRLAAIGVDDEERRAQRLMAQVNLAFAVLNDTTKREEYASIMRRGGEAAVKAEEAKADEMAMRIMRAEEAFKQGEMALRRDQLAQAIEAFQMAVELQPKESEYQALLAWAQFAVAPDKNAVSGATRKALQRASEANDRSPTARFYLGRVERMLGREREALQYFEEVLAIRPNHNEAASEARILRQRLNKK